jgi:hypothetical protein
MPGLVDHDGVMRASKARCFVGNRLSYSGGGAGLYKARVGLQLCDEEVRFNYQLFKVVQECTLN